MLINFSDKTTWDGGSKTAISVRDGVLEYLGAEIGHEPKNKVFTVYRSPATIANVAMMMTGIPLTNDHVDLDSEPVPVGSVAKAEMIDYTEEGTDTRLAIKNTVDLSAEILDTLANGKNELSLGYRASLNPHDTYDFEQRDIEPHHLAIVAAGRCGHGCKFIDRKGTNMKKEQAFIDAEGNINLEQIAEVAMALEGAIRQMPIDELQKVLPQLQAIVEVGKAASGEPMPQAGDEVGPDGEKAGEGALPEDMPQEKVDEEVLDADAPEEEMKDEEKEEMEKKDIKDSADFKDALKAAIDNHNVVVGKAVQYLDEGYDFSEKDTSEIMSDAVATQHDISVLDSKEIVVAFKLLKKDSKYKNFGDSETVSDWSTVGEKEIN